MYKPEEPSLAWLPQTDRQQQPDDDQGRTEDERPEEAQAHDADSNEVEGKLVVLPFIMVIIQHLRTAVQEEEHHS